jgi:hypothetical protein
VINVITIACRGLKEGMTEKERFPLVNLVT